MISKRTRSYIYLTLTAVIWGVAGPVIRYTIKEGLNPFTFLTYRFFLSLLALVPIMIASGEKFPNKSKDTLDLFITSLVGSTFTLGLLFVGLKYTGVLESTILSAVTPIFVVLACAIFLNDRITKKETIGITIAFLGTLVVILQPVFNNGYVGTSNLIGNILLFLGKISSTAHIILFKKQLRKGITPLTITVSLFFVGFITLLPLSVLENHGIQNTISIISSLNLPSHLGVIYMALISGALGYFLNQKGHKSIESSEAVLFSYLQGLFATPLAVFWLGEKITTPFIVGTIIVVIGIIIAQYKDSFSLARRH